MPHGVGATAHVCFCTLSNVGGLGNEFISLSACNAMRCNAAMPAVAIICRWIMDRWLAWRQFSLSLADARRVSGRG